MKSLTTFTVESKVGAVLLAALGVFFISFFLSSASIFESDMELELSNSQAVQVKIISDSEKVLIKNWVAFNDIYVPEGQSYYRYILRNYPNKPWTD